MNSNWQLYLKRAFRLAELLVALALLAVLVELLLVYLDRPSAGPYRHHRHPDSSDDRHAH